MGKKDRQRKKLREFAKLKNRQRNLRKSVQNLKDEVQRKAKEPENSNQIALGNDEIEEINENSPLLSAPSRQEETKVSKKIDIDIIDAHPLHEGPKNDDSPQVEVNGIEGKSADKTDEEDIKSPLQNEPGRKSALQSSIKDFSDRSVSPLQSITSGDTPMSELELPVSSSNSLERADDIPVVQPESQTLTIKSLPIAASPPEVLVSGAEMSSYGYGSIPESIEDVEDGANPPYIANTSSDELVHDLTRRRIFSSCMCTYLFFIAMDSSIILVIVSKIASEFHELWRLSLVISAYLLSNAIGQLVFLKLSLISSVKLLLCIAQFSFILGSYLSWDSIHFWTFIFARCVTGFGGGSLIALKSTIMNRFSKKNDNRYSLSASMITFSLGVAIGPFVVSLFDSSHGSGWKNAFLIPVPFCLVNASIMLADMYSVKNTLHHGSPRPTLWKRFKKTISSPDLYEILTLALFLLCFVQVTSLDLTSLEHSTVIQVVLFSVIIVCGILFLLIETSDTYMNSVISMSLQGDKHLIWTMMGISFCFAALMCIIPFGTTYFIIVLNLNTLQLAERLLPFFFSIVVGYFSVCYFWKSKRQNYLLKFVLSGVTLILYVALMGVGLSLPVWKQYICLSLPFLGSSMILTLLSNLYHEYHEQRKSPISGSIVYCFGAVGGTVGVSLGGYVFHKTLIKIMHEEVMKFSKQGYLKKDLLKIIKHATRSSDWAHESAPKFIFQTLIECYLQACRNVFKLSALFFTITVVTIFIFNRIH
ncbi:Vba4p [Saccharomyces paradoxus]|uniref:Vba4p n=1 Tax=Saccharomyces paradoxus TaxID=27291 RepID=A0A8B8UNM1_SACPA|nr:Vba4 [Saccharomyces paradoxus]QHS72331.1 Vba4 [Saccharomyces paradoxus]